jgi:hypothetical protein
MSSARSEDELRKGWKDAGHSGTSMLRYEVKEYAGDVLGLEEPP